MLWRSIRLDTHALVWYLTGDKKITKKAIESIDLVISNRVIGYIPNASLLELLWITKIKDERLRSKDPNHPKITGLVFEDVLACLKKVENIFFVNIELEDFELVTQNIKAGLELHDSIITAIAIKTGSKLITNDEIIRESGLVEVVW